ncbi:MAG: IS110 family transposase [Thermoplasmata archaeon]
MGSESAVEGETFVGLDVHKSTIVATAVDAQGRRIDQSTIGPTDQDLIDYLSRLPGVKKAVLEVCPVWEHLYDAATSTGTSVLVSNPYRVRLIADASIKTDKVDSEALATLLRLRAIPAVYVADPETRAVRQLVRDRQFYRVKERAIMNHLYGFLLRHGVPYEERILTKPRRREELRDLHLPEVDRGLDALAALAPTSKRLDAAIHEAFLQSKEAQLLASIPGIGDLIAVTLAAYLCPIDRFAHFDQVSSYAGLCPTTFQSSRRSVNGPLKYDCNRMLRWAMIEASWVHRREEKSGYVSRVGRRIARRKGGSRGAVASAHALLRVVYAILKRGTPYSHNAPERPSCKLNEAAPSRRLHDS